MKKHIFRLQKVLKAKKIKQDVEQKKLMSEKQNLQKEQAHLDQLNVLEAKVLEDVKKERLKKTTGHRFHHFHLYQHQVEKYVEQQNQQVAEAHTKVEQQREQLIDAVKDTQMLDKLKEKDYQNYVKQLNMKEQKQLDEISQLQPMRRDKS